MVGACDSSAGGGMDRVRESLGLAGLAALTYLVSPRPIRDPVTKNRCWGQQDQEHFARYILFDDLSSNPRIQDGGTEPKIII